MKKASSTEEVLLAFFGQKIKNGKIGG